MIDRANSRRPVSSFSTPRLAEPASVAAARVAFEQMTARTATARGTLRELQDALKAAERVDRENATATFQEGGDPAPPLDAQAGPLRAQIAQLQEELPAMQDADDLTGNELARQIAQERERWLEGIGPAEAAAAEAFDEALAAAGRALQELGEARRAREWLGSFDLGLATVGKQQQFSGGRVAPVRSFEIGLQGEHAPEALLRLLALVTESLPTPRKATGPGFGARVAKPDERVTAQGFA